MNRSARFACVAALLVAATAQAQGVKKYITPDGRTIYSDVPVPGAREVGEIAPPRQVAPEAQGAAAEDARNAEERAREADKRLRERAAQQARIDAAQAQLEAASAALEGGREPLPGERIGTAGGNSRLTEDYHRRQKANEAAVAEAQQRLDAARAGR
jgi:hypothetical protein